MLALTRVSALSLATASLVLRWGEFTAPAAVAVLLFLVGAGMELSRSLDTARMTAARREAELATEREQARHARELHAVRMAAAVSELEHERARALLSRVLHDRVLQTLEFLGNEGLLTDPQMRDHVAAEATWLRDLVRGELGRRADTLPGALDTVAEQQTRAGMRVELNTSGLGQQVIPDDVTEAISGAVTELLTNVRKHSGARRAVVRAVAKQGAVTVTVLDRGCGFDPVKVTGGMGLRESVIARIQQVGGSVVVTSWPQAGTHVEIKVPLPAPHGAPAQLVSLESGTCPAAGLSARMQAKAPGLERRRLAGGNGRAPRGKGGTDARSPGSHRHCR
jgi:signal transduction histidine kinase